MAIYHLHIKNISRGDGRSAVAAAAYRSGQRLWNARENQWTDFTRKQAVIHTEIIAPDHAPLWASDREQLWNKVEAAEKRKDARLCKEVVFALPKELSRSQQIDLARSLAGRYVALGIVTDIGIHDDENGNPHGHMLLTTRPIEGEAFGRKLRELDSKKFVTTTRTAWSDMANAALNKAGVGISIDHRSLKAQGISRPPQVHQGPTVREMIKRGAEPTSKIVEYKSRWGNVRQVDYRNIDTGNRVDRSKEVKGMERNYDELVGVQRQIAELRDQKPERHEERRAHDHRMIELYARRDHLLTRVDREDIERGFGMGEKDQRELLTQWDRENRPAPDREGRPVHPKNPSAVREDRDDRAERSAEGRDEESSRYVRPTVREEPRAERKQEQVSRPRTSAERRQLDRDIEKIRTNRFLNDDQKTERLMPLMSRSVELERQEHKLRERADRGTEHTRDERQAPAVVREREERDFDEMERQYERSRGVDEGLDSVRERTRDRDDDPTR